MDRSSEDALWRAIVENYGERADLDDAPVTSDDVRPGSTEVSTATPTRPTDEADDRGGAGADTDRGDGADGAGHEAARDEEAARRAREFEAQHEVPERFVPPVPPPLPYVPPSRLLAWSLMVGGPLLLLLSLVLDFWLPGIIQLLAVAGFVGGFVYLVVRMPRDPRDPWDDGARV